MRYSAVPAGQKCLAIRDRFVSKFCYDPPAGGELENANFQPGGESIIDFVYFEEHYGEMTKTADNHKQNKLLILGGIEVGQFKGALAGVIGLASMAVLAVIGRYAHWW